MNEVDLHGDFPLFMFEALSFSTVVGLFAASVLLSLVFLFKLVLFSYVLKCLRHLEERPASLTTTFRKQY